MVKTVYVDNAATTAMSDEAIAAMMPYLKDNFGNPSSLLSSFYNKVAFKLSKSP